MDPDALARQRAGEAAEAARILGIAGQHFLGYPDGELVDDTALARPRSSAGCASSARRTVLGPDPTAVFFGEDYFNHRDHRTIGLRRCSTPCRPRPPCRTTSPRPAPAYQVQTALLSGTLEPTVWVDVTATIDDKVAAVSCHRSQFADGGEWARRAVRDAVPGGRAPGRGRLCRGLPAAAARWLSRLAAEPAGSAPTGVDAAPCCTSTWTRSSPRWRSSTTRRWPGGRSSSGAPGRAAWWRRAPTRRGPSGSTRPCPRSRPGAGARTPCSCRAASPATWR